jgi:hypothetical protein
VHCITSAEGLSCGVNFVSVQVVYDEVWIGILMTNAYVADGERFIQVCMGFGQAESRT